MIQELSAPDAVTPEAKEHFTALAEGIAQAGAAGFGEIAILRIRSSRRGAAREGCKFPPTRRP